MQIFLEIHHELCGKSNGPIHMMAYLNKRTQQLPVNLSSVLMNVNVIEAQIRMCFKSNGRICAAVAILNDLNQHRFIKLSHVLVSSFFFNYGNNEKKEKKTNNQIQKG